MSKTVVLVVELFVLSALVLITRCANYEDVLVDGKIYFLDADCYARMSRARLVAEHPGTIVRRHDFENFPDGTTPHTTAPLDYLIVALAAALRPLTTQPLDLAGAIISPLLALVGGWFLWWWLGRFSAPGRYAALLVYTFSAILVHGTALGRPDHQSLLIVLLLVAFAAEWILAEKPSVGWSLASGLSWGMALWVSLYEPLILLGGLALFSLFSRRSNWTAPSRRFGWFVFLGVVLLAGVIERRWPEWPGSQPFFANWAATIGELKPVGLTNLIWFYWCGGLLLLSPLLLIMARRNQTVSWTFLGLFVLAFGLTLWEARWGYFFAVIFLLTLPAQIAVVRQKWIGWAAVVVVLLPFLIFWDGQFWPNDEAAASRAEKRIEMAQWRAAASRLADVTRAPVLTPWWLAPATAYWSGQPTVAGSSHESLPGIVASTRFYLSTSPGEAEMILRQRRVQWVLVYDAERVAENSAAILDSQAGEEAFCRVLDRFPSQAPRFLALTGQNETCRTYQVRK